MKKLLLLIPVLMLGACRYDKAELPVPDLVCVTDAVKHVVPVTMGDNFFNPQHIEIIAGDTVRWDYPTGSSAHTATCDGTSGTTLPSGAATFDTGTLVAGQSSKIAIGTPGSYTYFCTIHGIAMSGTIVVKARCQ